DPVVALLLLGGPAEVEGLVLRLNHLGVLLDLHGLLGRGGHLLVEGLVLLELPLESRGAARVGSLALVGLALVGLLALFRLLGLVGLLGLFRGLLLALLLTLDPRQDQGSNQHQRQREITYHPS